MRFVVNRRPNKGGFMKHQTELLVASSFSLAVGISAGLYALWPNDSTAEPATKPTEAACSPILRAGPIPTGYRKPYEFTTDWFTPNIENWKKILAPYVGEPVSYLEIGVWEGRSMIWMLDNVLTHEGARAVGVDIDIKSRYTENLRLSGSCAKVKNIRGRSQEVMRDLPRESYDLIYIDGSHVAQDVTIDAVLAFDLLKDGGLIIFDDYEMFSHWAKGIRTKSGVDVFLLGYRPRLDVVHHDYQIVVRKLPDPCASDHDMVSRIGAYCYNWNAKEMTRIADRSKVDLLDGEIEILQSIARKSYGDYSLSVTTELKQNPVYQKMNRRLRLM
jgi:hypothetical protein